MNHVGNAGQPRAAIIGLGFIAGLHLDALRRIGIQIVGALGTDAERASGRAQMMGIPRAYESLAELCADDSVDVVHVTSPNHLHAPHVLALLDAGKHVLCEKPLAVSVAEGKELVARAAANNLVNAVCFVVRYYPVVQQARTATQDGQIGMPRLLTGSYAQDWLFHSSDWNWRLQPTDSGQLRAVSDIGSHWFDLAQFVTGKRITEVMADLHTFVPVRQRPTGPVETFAASSRARSAETVDVQITSEDAATILLRLEDGARGAVVISQVSAGRKNTIRLDVAGSTASLAWNSENSERLWFGHRDEPNQILLRDPALMGPAARATSHYPAGHSEGFAELFLGLFETVYQSVRDGKMPQEPTFPTFADGLRGLLIEDAVLRSSKSQAWADVEEA